MQNPSLNFHIGAHGNVSRYLNKIMLLNKKALSTNGTLYFSNKEYSQAVSICSQHNDKSTFSDSDRELFLDLLIDDDEFDRLIFSFDAFLSSRKTAMGEGNLYPSLEKKILLLKQQFLGNKIHLLLGIESLISFPTTLFKDLDVEKGLFLNSDIYRQLTWTDVINRIKRSWPEVEVTVFLVEDTILNWPRIVHRLVGLTVEDVFKLKGIFAYPLDQIDLDERRAFFRPIRNAVPKSFEEYETRVRPFIKTNQIPKPSSIKFPRLSWDSSFLNDLTLGYEEDIENLRCLDSVEVI